METLGLSDSTPRTGGRLKSLFWPSVQTSSDVDYLGSQGLWVCSAIGVLSFAVLAFAGKPILGLFILLLYYLSGVGVREGSRYAAGWAFATYFGDMVITGPHIVKILLSALRLSNFRAIWIASRWKPDSQESAPPPRWSETWTDKFSYLAYLAVAQTPHPLLCSLRRLFRPVRHRARQHYPSSSLRSLRMTI
jgi:hypothetical protein